VYSGAGEKDAWGVRGINNTKQQALDNDVAIYFDLIIAPELNLTLESIQMPWFAKMPNGTSDPEVSWEWQYSLDYGTGATGWTPIECNDVLPYTMYDWLSLDLTDNEDFEDLSGVTVTFRLLLWGGTNNGNSMVYFGKDNRDPNQLSRHFPNMLTNPNTIIVNGTIIPEPSAMALLVLSSATLLLRRKRKSAA